MEIWSRDKQLLEFSKEFVIHGEKSLRRLLTGENAKHPAYQTAEALAYLLPRGADFVALSITGWLDRVDKVSRRNNRLKVQHAIDPAGNNETMYKQRLRQLLIKCAVEIYVAFELQLQYVFRRINDKYNSVSRSQAIKVLAEFSSKACTKSLAESPETFPGNWHLHEAVLTHDKKLASKIKKTRNQVVAGQDQLVLMLENGQKIISKSDFFKLPIPAFNQVGTRSLVTTKDGLVLHRDHVKRWKDEGSLLGLLRRPFDFEWKQMMTSNKGKVDDFVHLPLKSGSKKLMRMDLSNFTWYDPSNVIENLYNTIGQSLPLESMEDLYGKVDSLVKTLDGIQDDLKAELLKNNEVVLKVLEAMKAGTMITTSSSIQRPLKELRFNIRDPIPSFTGRCEFLEKIHQEFVDSSIMVGGRNNFVLSQVKVISGLGGIGKSETARKYINEYENCYDHIIWIDSETNNTMTQNFRTLAQTQLNLNVKSSEGNWRAMEDVVKEVYETICGRTSLFIFDNAQCYEDWEQPAGDSNNNNGIKPFLPPSLNSKLIKPKILITSRNHAWKLLPSKPLTLDILDKDESIQFITNRLDIQQHDSTSMKLATDLADLLGGLPLSLQVAASCILKLSEKKSVNVTQAIQLYIEEYSVGSNCQEFLHYFDKSVVPKSIFLTMLLSFENIQKMVVHKFGLIALKLIKYIAFFYSEEIPMDLIISLFPNNLEQEVEDGLALLKNFSLIKTFKTHIAVHRQVQQATIEKMKGDGGEHVEILGEILENFKQFISSKTLLYPSMKVTLTNALTVITHLKSQLDTNMEFQQFFEFVASKMFVSGRHLEALSIYETLHQFYVDTLGHDHVQTLGVDYQVARCLEFSGNFEDALQKYRNVYDQQKKLLGLSNPTVWKTLSKVASVSHFMANNNIEGALNENFSHDKILKYQQQENENEYPYSEEILMKSDPNPKTIQIKGTVLRELERYEESLEMFQSIFEFQKISHGLEKVDENIDAKIKNTRNNKAQLLQPSQVENQDLAHSLFTEVLKKLQENLGDDDPQVLRAHYNFASLLTTQGKFENALILLTEVSHKTRKSLGEDHILVFMNQMAIAFILIKQGEFGQAAILCHQAYKGQRTIGQDSHPSVLSILNEMAYAMYTNQMYDDAWQLYQIVDERQGEGHPDEMTTKHTMGLVLFALKRYWDAFKLYEGLYEQWKPIFGGDHPDVLMAQMNMALALEKHGKHRRALKLYNMVYEKTKKLLGPTHPQTLSLQYSIINLFDSHRNCNNLSVQN